MNKVILSGYIEVPSDELEQVRNALPSHIAKTRNEEGCLTFEVHETENGRFSVYEEFKSKEAFELHQKRTQNSEWGALTKNVKRNYRIQKQ